MFLKKRLSNILVINRINYYMNDKRFQSNKESYLKKKFKKKVGYFLDLDNPKSYNEKLQWLKLYWDDPMATVCADKYAVREYVKNKGLESTLNQLIAVYDSVDEINFSNLPEQFVLKVTHNSGGVIVCKNKQELDILKARKKLLDSMKLNYYKRTHEWVYKEIKPHIICEKYIANENGDCPKDYKIFCFKGTPKFLFVASERGYQRGKSTTKFDFYTCNWELIPVKQHYKNSGKKLSKPKNLDKMLEMAAILSSDFPQARIDFYNENGEIIFGEITFFHFSGMHPFVPQKYDFIFGEYIDLPEKEIE